MMYIICGLLLISDICFFIACIRTTQKTNSQINQVISAYTNVVSSALILDTYVRVLGADNPILIKLHDQFIDEVSKLPNTTDELLSK